MSQAKRRQVLVTGDAGHAGSALVRGGKIPSSMTDPRYYNVKTMQQRELR